MLWQNIDYFKSKPLELPKITILVDHGYHPEKIIQALEQIYPQIMTKIQFQLSAKPSKAEKEAKGQSGFVPIPARWVIERSNAWVERCKSLVKNFDRTLERANAKLKLCFIRLMLKRLAASIHVDRSRNIDPTHIASEWVTTEWLKDIKWVLYTE